MQATLFTDGGARGNPGPAGIGYVLSLEDGREFRAGHYLGEATNNQAEYKALLAGLQRAQRERVDELLCRLDSELVVKQLSGEYRVKDLDLKPLFEQVNALVPSFLKVSFEHVPREENAEADGLVNEAIDAAVGKKKAPLARG